MPLTSPGNDDDTGENHQPTLRKNTAEPVEQTLKQNTSVALEARRRIDAMFKVDSKFDDMEPGGRKAARDAELRPLMEDLFVFN